jgi:heptosyltransferase II
MSRALVVQTSFLGDMVLTTPLIERLAARGPVDVVATPANAALLANHPLVRRIIPYDKRGVHAGIGGFRSIARLVSAESDDDVAYLAQGSWRSAALARVAGYSHRVGFDTSAGRALYTRLVRYAADRHHAERLWSLGAADGDDRGGPPRPRLFPGGAEEDAVAGVLAGGGHQGEPLIALAPGSVWATKRWPYYAALARRLTSLGRVVIVGSADDAEAARDIVRETDGGAIDATGQLSLLASAALIGRARVLVTNDSAPLHLASAMNTPTVALFGPTVPAFGFGPLAERARVAGVETLPCRPCDRHGPSVCPLTHWRCMRDLSVAAVEAAVAEVQMEKNA